MNFMFVVAHPDDEVLGAGGYIRKLIREGHEVCVVIMNSDYEKTRKEMFSDMEVSHEIMGIKDRALLSYRNMDFYNENHRDMVESIEREIELFQPDYIFTHNPTDLHSDHHITSMVAQQASRLWQRHQQGHKIKGLYFMEVLSSTNWSCTNFEPDTYAEINEEDLAKKIDALKCYKGVVRPAPHPRSEDCIKSLAIMRGANVGFKYAEAFKTVWRDSL